MKKDDKQFGKDGSEGMDKIAKTVFAPIYPVIAENAIKETNKSEGICIDIGSGPGQLAIAMAKVGNFKVYSLDSSPDMQAIAAKNFEQECPGSITLVHGDVHNIPLESDFADLMVSRGSVFFWDDPEQAFSEIERVLKTGGKAYIGGGFGNSKLRQEIVEKMTAQSPEWEKRYKSNMSDGTSEKLLNAAKKLSKSSFKKIDDDSGLWILIEKESQ